MPSPTTEPEPIHNLPPPCPQASSHNCDPTSCMHIPLTSPKSKEPIPLPLSLPTTQSHRTDRSRSTFSRSPDERRYPGLQGPTPPFTHPAALPLCFRLRGIPENPELGSRTFLSFLVLAKKANRSQARRNNHHHDSVRPAFCQPYRFETRREVRLTIYSVRTEALYSG